MVRNQKQSPTIFYPIAHHITFFLGEGGMVCAFVVHVFGAQCVGNHEDLESVERGFGKQFPIADNVVTVVAYQIGERFIASCSCMEVVVRFVEKNPRKVLV